MSVRAVAGLVARLRPADDADLVRQHGPMVAGVCRRLLGPGPDADDAAQAVWLVFLRRRHVVRDGGAGPFLYGVAVRTARHARSRRRRWSPLPDLPDTRPSADPELAGLIDAELLALPAGMRAAVLLCEVEGRSLKQAASDLGVPVGTLASRLARGRQRLADRLKRRGVVVSVAALSGWLASHGTAAVPAGLASAAAVTLSRRVLSMLLLDKLRRVAAGVLLAGGLVTGGVGVMTGRANPPAKPAPPKPDRLADLPKKSTKVFDQIWYNHPASVVEAVFAMLDDPERAVDYLDEQLLGLFPDPAQVTSWLADIGVGDPAGLKAAAARRRAVLDKAGDATPRDDAWPPAVARRGLRATLSVPSVYARLRKLATELLDGPPRLEVFKILAAQYTTLANGQPAPFPADTLVSFRDDIVHVEIKTDDNGRRSVTLPTVNTSIQIDSKAREVGQAILLLERIGSARAVGMLERLAGSPEDPWAKPARAALDRLAKK